MRGTGHPAPLGTRRPAARRARPRDVTLGPAAYFGHWNGRFAHRACWRTTSASTSFRDVRRRFGYFRSDVAMRDVKSFTALNVSGGEGGSRGEGKAFDSDCSSASAVRDAGGSAT